MKSRVSTLKFHVHLLVQKAVVVEDEDGLGGDLRVHRLADAGRGRCLSSRSRQPPPLRSPGRRRRRRRSLTPFTHAVARSRFAAGGPLYEFPLLRRAAELQEALAELVTGQLLDRAHTTVAQVVNVIPSLPPKGPGIVVTTKNMAGNIEGSSGVDGRDGRSVALGGMRVHLHETALEELLPSEFRGAGRDRDLEEKIEMSPGVCTRE